MNDPIATSRKGGKRRATAECIAEILSRPVCTVQEAATVAGISRDAAYAAANSGELPVVRIGKRILVPTAALKRMLQLDPEPSPSH